MCPCISILPNTEDVIACAHKTAAAGGGGGFGGPWTMTPKTHVGNWGRSQAMMWPWGEGLKGTKHSGEVGSKVKVPQVFVILIST